MHPLLSMIHVPWASVPCGSVKDGFALSSIPLGSIIFPPQHLFSLILLAVILNINCFQQGWISRTPSGVDASSGKTQEWQSSNEDISKRIAVWDSWTPVNSQIQDNGLPGLNRDIGFLSCYPCWFTALKHFSSAVTSWLQCTWCICIIYRHSLQNPLPASD